MDKLLLIDGNSLTYRAYYGSAYSSKQVKTNSKGTPINAVLTLYKMIKKITKQYKPTNIFIAFDAGKKTFRHEKMESYKGGRQKTPKELIIQFPIIKEMISNMGIKHFELNNIEADDIIATLAKENNKNYEVLVLSSDKDLYQLVDDNISIIVPQNGSKPNLLIYKEMFYSTLGYSPNQVKDFKGLVGDSSDNLPGVKGIGAKTAVRLLKKYNTLNGIYENIKEINESIKQKLIKDQHMAFLCKDIATLVYDVNIPILIQETKWNDEINENLMLFFQKYELNSLLYYNKKSLSSNEEKDENKSNQLSFENLIF